MTNHTYTVTLRLILGVIVLALAPPLSAPARADAPTLSLLPEPTHVCDPFDSARCGFTVTPGMVVTVTGTAFDPSDTSVTLAGIPSDQDSTATCPVTNGTFSCQFVMPDVPGQYVEGTIQSGIHYPLVTWTATGSPAQDRADLNLHFQAGAGIWPISGAPGSTVTVYGTGYYGTGNGGETSGLPDTATVVTFGTNDPSGLTGSGPSVLYVGASTSGPVPCIPSIDGSLSDNGPCTFKVPFFVYGTYNVGIMVLQLGTIPDVLACGSPWCVPQFTITRPEATSVTPREAKPGDTIQVVASNFATTDRNARITIDGVIVTSTCPIVSSSSGGSLSCSVVVPPTSTAPGPHGVAITGVEFGDSTEYPVRFVVPGEYPLSLSATTVVPGQELTVSGDAFDPRDTSVSLTFIGQNVTPSSGCPVVEGTFSCRVVVPDSTSGVRVLQATGAPAGDSVTEYVTITSSLAINPASGPVGSRVTLSGAGFSIESNWVSATLNGEVLGLATRSLDYPQILPTEGRCPMASLWGRFPSNGYACDFQVPETAHLGANTLTVTDAKGASVTTTFTLTPSVVPATAQGSAGALIPVTGYGFATGPIALTLGGMAVNDPSTCQPSATGALACSFVVPDLVPGTYTLAAGSSGDTLASAPFSVVPALSIPGGGAFVDSTTTVTASGFPAQDSSVSVTFDDASLPASCSSSGGTSTDSFTCTFTVPNLGAGTYDVRIVGDSTGAVASASFDVFGLSISPPATRVYSGIEVKGSGFAAGDTSATFSVGGVAGDPSDVSTSLLGCPVSNGTFDCSMRVPPLAGGTQTVTATGNTGDRHSSTFRVLPVLSPASDYVPAGTLLSISGPGFLPSDGTATLSFNGDVLASCPVDHGWVSCSFTIPAVPIGTYEIEVAGDSGDPNDATVTNIVITAGAVLSPTEALVGDSVGVTGTNFASGDTSATLAFYFGNPENSVAVGPPSGCPIVNGTLAAPCSFVVPQQLPGSRNVTPGGGYGVLVTGSSGDQTSTPFTVLGPTGNRPFQLVPASGTLADPDTWPYLAVAPIGSVVTVTGGTFLSYDTTATLNFSGVDVGPVEGCPVVDGTIPSCTFTVPAQLPGGPVVDMMSGWQYTVTATGNNGDSVQAAMLASATVSLASAVIAPDGKLIVSGVGFPPFDNGDRHFPESVVFGTNPFTYVSPLTCPVNPDGSFTCTLTLQEIYSAPVPPGQYTLLMSTSVVRQQIPFTVASPVPTVTITGGSFTYDGLPHTAVCQVTGSDGAPVAGSCSLTYDGSAAPPTDAGTYAVLATFTSADAHYVSTTATGSITIDRAPQTIVFGPIAPVTYGVPAFEVAATAGLPVSLTANTPSICGVSDLSVIAFAVGDCSITASEAGSVNYLPATAVTQSFRIDPASLTVTASSATTVYGDPVPAITPLVSGFVNGEGPANMSAAPVCAIQGLPPAAPSTGRYTTTCSGAVAPNYTVAYVNGALTIEPATLTIVANAQTKRYAMPDPPLTYATTGFKYSETATSVLTGGLIRSVGAGIGSYAITQGTLAASTDYAIAFTGAAFVITADLPPLMSTLAPNTAVAGASADLPLQVSGDQFVPGATVQWNGASLQTQFIDPQHLSAAVPVSNLSVAGVALVTVSNPADGGGGESSAAPFFVTNTATTVAGAVVGTGSDGTVTTGGTGGQTPGSVTSAWTGAATVALAEYGSNPGGAFAFSTGDPAEYFDVHVTPGASLTGLTVTVCTAGANTVYWFDGTGWQPASDQSYDVTTGCGMVTVTTTTSPSLSQLTGTYFVAFDALGRFVALSSDSTWLQAGATAITGDVGALGRHDDRHPTRHDDGDRHLDRHHDGDRHGEVAAVRFGRGDFGALGRRDNRHSSQHEDGDRYPDQHHDGDRHEEAATVRIDQGAAVLGSGSRVVGDTVLLMRKASIQNLIDNVLIDRGGRILGTRTEPMPAPFAALPAWSPVVAGTKDVTVTRRKTVTLAAGSYRDVRVRRGATLVLTGGRYQIRSLELEDAATVLFQAPTTLGVQVQVMAGARARLIAGTGLSASQVMIDVQGRDDACRHGGPDEDGDDAGPVAVRLGSRSKVQANIYAPNGTIWLQSKSRATGAFIARHVRIGAGVRLTLDSAFR